MLLISIPFFGLGQEWSNSFNQGNENTQGESIKQTSDGNYILAGGIYDNDENDGVVLKINTNGTLQWSKIFGTGNNHERLYSIQETNDGGYVFCGVKDYWPGPADWDVWLIKTDSNGNQQWEQNFDVNSTNDRGRSVQQTSDGGFIITGRTSPLVSSDNDILLIKTDGNGNQLWNQLLNSNITNFGRSEGFSVEQTSDGGYIISGICKDYPCLIKTDDNGSKEWDKIFGNMSEEPINDVHQTSDGGYILTGTTENSDIWLIKTDINGNQQWDKNFGGTGYDKGNSVQQTSDGGYIITGMMYYDSLFCLIKTDGSGNLEWNKNYGCCEGFSVQQTNDGGYIMCGYTEINGSADDYIHVIKTNSQGNITSTTKIPIPNPNRTINKTINFQGQEIQTETNQPYIEIYNDGSTEKKLIIEK